MSSVSGVIAQSIRKLTVLVAFAALTACATPRETPPRTSRINAFVPIDHDAATSVLRAGFNEIAEKAINPPSIDQLFLAGHRDFWHLDPAFGIGVDSDSLTLIDGDEVVTSFDRPGPEDLKGWTETTILLFEAARRHSRIARYADAESLYSTMFDAAVSQIDKYSRYSGRRVARSNRDIRNGFVGLGFTYDILDEGIVVRSVTDGGPMATAGIKPGDIVLAIEGRTTDGLTRDAIQRLVSGPPQTTVLLAVRRAGDTAIAQAEVRRGLIIPNTVVANVENGLGRIEIIGFNLRTASDVSSAVARMRREGINGLILDVRSDPGGLLDQCIEVADLFLDGGVIATLSGRHPGSRQYYEAKPGDIAGGLPIVVLIDGKSASAAEILAAALVDNGRALTVGTNTLGKGSVQTLIRLPNDGELALTWSQTWSPNGYRIQDLGLLPTICTSGFAGPIADLAAETLRDRANPAKDREARRQADSDGDSRASLRNLCPAESRPHRQVDAEVAERLIADRALYAKAATTSVAANP